jgi:choline dehydrogenase
VSLYDQTKLHRAFATLIQYLATHKGLGTTNGIEAGAFLRTSQAGAEPDIQLHFIPVIMLDHMREQGPGHGFMAHACQLRPHSRGRIRLWSADPQAAPRIEPHYLSDARDLPVLVEAVKICRQIFAQPAFDAYRGDELMPGASIDSDADLEAFIRRHAETIYHPVGTCKMGEASDSQAVVDNHCRVHGLEGLRVVDASVMPALIGGNTNAPTIMIAEKVAASILNAG